MAFTRLALFPGATEQHYRAIDKEINEAVKNQPERIMHSCGQVDRGWQLVQVWKSKEALDKFVEDHLAPAMKRAGEKGYPAPPEIIDFETVDLFL